MCPALAKRQSKDKVKAHRSRLRARGLRPIQIWVPDVRAATFRREAHRQSLAVAAGAAAADDQAFIDAVSDETDA
ncbi:MAG: antitoxin MazE family protein [Roseiarcus sp.]|uniref:antitoxin MazE-like protein n=1 Tax=Roseiarcus sp. TaxID=1969460 RepID=UPI003BB16A5C